MGGEPASDAAGRGKVNEYEPSKTSMADGAYNGARLPDDRGIWRYRSGHPAALDGGAQRRNGSADAARSRDKAPTSVIRRQGFEEQNIPVE